MLLNLGKMPLDGLALFFDAGEIGIKSLDFILAEGAELLRAFVRGGEPLDIGFNITYLLDVLNSRATENIECALGDANSSALITEPGNGDFQYVVMPMRI